MPGRTPRRPGFAFPGGGSGYRVLMRHRQRLVISRQTGDAALTTEAVDDDAGFAQRIRELKDSLPDIGRVEGRFADAVCDGRGRRVALDFDNPALPRGWAATGHGDFCPGCQSLN